MWNWEARTRYRPVPDTKAANPVPETKAVNLILYMIFILRLSISVPG